jgi:capsular polysaccharide biosynthesis protein
MEIGERLGTIEDPVLGSKGFMFAYQLKNKLKQTLKRHWRFLKVLPYKMELQGARILSSVAPSMFSVEHNRLYPPKQTCQSTAAWICESGKDMAATIYEVDRACVVHSSPPKSIYDSVRIQLLRDQAYDYPATFVATIPNGRVWGDGYIITPDDKLLGDVSLDFRSIENRRSSISLYWKLQQIAENRERVAVLATDGSDLYYHWLFQLLPRFELIRRAGIDLNSIDYFFINGLNRPFQRESLEALGIDPKKVIESSHVPYLRARELIVPSIPLGNGCFRPWMCQFLRNTFLPKTNGGGIESPSRRLYISRGLAGYRRVLNEAEVTRLLRRRGFEEIKLETLSMRQQAATMASCEVVVAPHGGGFSNLVFCSPGTKVIEIFSPELVAGFFWKISSQLGLDYYYLLGKGSPATQDSDYEQAWDGFKDIEVDLSLLEKTLDLAKVS